jgi:prolipoprotein diacylglyceryltransferase
LLAQYTQLLFWSIPTFRLAVSIAILLSLALSLYRHHPRGRVLDVYLGALVVGIIGSRLFHVALNWDYFTDNRAEIWVIETGGLDWHGAVLGGLLGMAMVLWIDRIIDRRIRHFYRIEPAKTRSSFNMLLTSLTLALPLIGLGGWVGCLAAGCGYGKEVDSLANYPRWMTSELVDVFGIVAPRYNAPYFGIVLSLIGLLIVLILMLLGHRLSSTLPSGRRFWGLLAFLSAGMFIIGFYRADHTYIIYGLRADQILDVIMGLWGLILALRAGQEGVNRHEQTPRRLD